MDNNIKPYSNSFFSKVYQDFAIEENTESRRFLSYFSNPFSQKSRHLRDISAQIRTLKEQMRESLYKDTAPSKDDLLRSISDIKTQINVLRTGILSDSTRLNALSNKLQTLKKVFKKIHSALELKIDNETLKELEKPKSTEDTFNSRLKKLEDKRLKKKKQRRIFEEKGRCFVVRKKSLAKYYAKDKSAEKNQLEYGKSMAVATDILSEVLKEMPLLSAREAFTYAIQSRRRVGIRLKHATAMKIGIKRLPSEDESMVSNVESGTYKNLGARLKKFIPKDEINFQFTAVLPFDKSKRILLDNYVYSEKTPYYNGLLHTDARLVDYMEENIIIPYFDKIKHTQYKDQKTCWHDLGLLFWWSIRQKYYVYSEPAATEVVTKALAQDRGFPIELPWKKGVIPWEEVIAQPDPEKFADDFSNSLFFGKNSV